MVKSMCVVLASYKQGSEALLDGIL